MCTNPPAPPENGLARIASSGVRFGPTCAEAAAPKAVDATNCPGITIAVKSNATGLTTFSIAIAVAAAQDEVFLQLDFSNPPYSVTVSVSRSTPGKYSTHANTL